MNLVDELYSVAAALTAAGVRYAVCGGVAVTAIPMTFGAGTDRERHVQRVSKIDGNEHLLIDLLLADAAFDGALDDVLEVELPEGPLRVVSRATLIRRKHPMTGDLDARSVATRLSDLRSRHVPESIDAARARLARDQPRTQESVHQTAARSLAELRALCELARALHRARPCQSRT